MSEKQNIIPWIEKYRPTQFDDIVLDPTNRIIFENIINKNVFPHLLFYGPPGCGKCFQINTPILLYNGMIKMVQDIKVGNIIMGDDSTPRTVLSLGKGEDELYEILPFKGRKSYVVNSEHILCLKYKSQIDNKYNIIELPVNKYLKLPTFIKNKLKVYKLGVDFPTKPLLINPYIFGKWLAGVSNEELQYYNVINNIQIPNNYKIDNKHIPNDYKINNKHNRLQLLAGLLDINGVLYKQKCYILLVSKTPLFDDIIYLISSLGFDYKLKKHKIIIYGNGIEDIPTTQQKQIIPNKLNNLICNFKVIPKGKGKYYGFTLNGNQRFMLGDFSVTHNTSTIINLINEYQLKHNVKNHIINKGNIIHLNASDERGIDIIRNQIYQFVSTKNFFDNGLKFVVLDEVDYMTKNAQQALKYLLQTSNINVRFCLICNYISKIDESLKNEFICIRFNQLPKPEIFKFIQNISIKENINLNNSMIEKIQSIYQSDIRSMINFIQSNHNSLLNKSLLECILHSGVWEQIHNYLLNEEPTNIIKEYLQTISIQYNVDIKQIIQNYFNYIICNKSQYVTKDYLNIIEMLIHNNENVPITTTINFFILSLIEYYKNL